MHGEVFMDAEVYMKECIKEAAEKYAKSFFDNQVSSSDVAIELRAATWASFGLGNITMTTKEVAQLLGKQPAWVRKMADQGRLPSIKGPGAKGDWVFPAPAIWRLMLCEDWFRSNGLASRQDRAEAIVEAMKKVRTA